MAFSDLTDTQLLTTVTMFEKKVKKLAKLGAGAGMATAVNNSHLRKLQAEAVARGLDLTAAKPAAASKSVSNGASKSVA